MVGGRYGLAENGLKWSESQEKSDDPRWPPPPLRWRLAKKLYRCDRPEIVLSHGRSVLQVAGGDASFGPKLHGSEMGQNGPTRCSRFWRVFPRVLELKMVFWGLGFHLAPKVMFI